jgi:hypothetical protein
MSYGCKWYCRRCLGNTGECRRKAWPSWFVRSESATGCPGGACLDELGSLLSAAWLLCGPWWPLLLGRNNCRGLDDQFVIAFNDGRYSSTYSGFLFRCHPTHLVSDLLPTIGSWYQHEHSIIHLYRCDLLTVLEQLPSSEPWAMKWHVVELTISERLHSPFYLE